MAIYLHPAVAVNNVSSRQIQGVDIGDASRPIDDTVGFGDVFDAIMGEYHPQTMICGFDPLHADAGPDPDADAFALCLDVRNGVSPWQEVIVAGLRGW